MCGTITVPEELSPRYGWKGEGQRMAEIRDVGPVRGLRREMTREDFERLCRLQCGIPQLLGWCGVEREKLERWCRRTYHRPLEEVMEMVRQDGLIEIREAAFDLMKKNASLVNQQLNRFLPQLEEPEEADREAALRAFAGLIGCTEEETVAEVFE